jgi:hypothetical protein
MVHCNFFPTAWALTRRERFGEVGHPLVLLVQVLTFSRVFTAVSVLLGITTILLFLYLVFLPRVRGVGPNVCSFTRYLYFKAHVLNYMSSIQAGEILMSWQSSYQSVSLFSTSKLCFLSKCVLTWVSRSSQLLL